MWEHVALLLLFFFTALCIVNINFHHVNEVFNSLTHDHLYHVTEIDIEGEDVYFDKARLRVVVDEHFRINLHRITYTYYITFYHAGEVANEEEPAKLLTINLQAPLGFSVNYDKTFTYYLT